MTHIVETFSVVHLLTLMSDVKTIRAHTGSIDPQMYRLIYVTGISMLWNVFIRAVPKPGVQTSLLRWSLTPYQQLNGSLHCNCLEMCKGKLLGKQNNCGIHIRNHLILPSNLNIMNRVISPASNCIPYSQRPQLSEYPNHDFN